MNRTRTPRNSRQSGRTYFGCIVLLFSATIVSVCIIFSFTSTSMENNNSAGGDYGFVSGQNIAQVGGLRTPMPILMRRNQTTNIPYSSLPVHSPMPEQNTVSKPSYSLQNAVTKPPHPPQVVLLSANASVTASVRGNLGPPEVVLSPNVDNWLEDRWQAARNMQGDPIPGPHFLRFALKSRAVEVTKVVLDFEAAFSNDYLIEAMCADTHEWNVIYNNAQSLKKNMMTVTTSKAMVKGISLQHVVHTISLSSGFALRDPRRGVEKGNDCHVSEVRVSIRRPATRWGTSLWSVEVWGYSIL